MIQHSLDDAPFNCNPLQITISMFQNEQGPSGMLGYFEAIASFSLPYDPVAKRKSSGDKSNHENVSELLS